MSNRVLNFFVKHTYKLRIFLDKILYFFIKPFNHWEILDQFKNKEITIVCNGPSLNKTDLEKIKTITIGMNKIDLIFSRTSWRPNMITCVNSLVIKQNKDFFNTTDIPLILPVRALYMGIRKRKNVLFFNIHDTIEFKDKLQGGLAFCGSTVTYTAMQIAASLSSSKINIVGMDHYFKNYTGKKAIEKFQGDDGNHFDPNYFKNSLWGLPDIEGSEMAYSCAKQYFDSKNIPIIDYTIEGKCQIFVKDNIEKIYAQV